MSEKSTLSVNTEKTLVQHKRVTFMPLQTSWEVRMFFIYFII